MATNCYKPVIEREGTSRFKRLPESLKEGYVRIDERDYKQLLAFTRKIANQFVYFDTANKPDGGWLEFFWQKLDETGLTAPHFGLFAAFLDLFSILQDDLNELGTQHLEYYYRDILGLEEEAAIPDEVFLIGELAKHVSTYELEEGTLLKTGMKEGDVEKLYTLKDDYTFNKASIGK